MNRLPRIAAILLATIPALANADDFNIEDDKLTALPKAVEEAIRSRKDFDYAQCKLIGKALDLSGKAATSGFAATTDNACGWGAAQGPIWVVLNGAKPAAVLEHSGYTLILGKESQNGLRNIVISASTAGHSSGSLWKFDGERYAKTSEKINFRR